jgi:hypothetical protein
MITKDMTVSRSFLRTATIAALGCLVGFSVVPSRGVAGQDTPGLARLDDKAPALPLAVSYDKVTDSEAGPYVLKLKNTSMDAITVSGTVYPSVGIHSDTKEKKLPERKIEAGDTWSIPGLAATDKVKIEGKGFSDLNVTVP